HLGERRPDLLARDHIVVAVADGAGSQRREVGARVRLREPLAPDLLALEDGGQVTAALLLGGLGDQRRARVQKADEVDAHVGRPRLGDLLVENQLLAERRAAPAELRRPVDACVPRVVEHSLPRRVALAARVPVLALGLGRKLRERLIDPRAQFGPEAFVLVGPAEVHCWAAYCFQMRTRSAVVVSVATSDSVLSSTDSA